MTNDYIEKTLKEFGEKFVNHGEFIYNRGSYPATVGEIKAFIRQALQEAQAQAIEGERGRIIEWAKSQKMNVFNATMNPEREAENRALNKLINELTPQGDEN